MDAVKVKVEELTAPEPEAVVDEEELQARLKKLMKRSED